MDELEHIKIVKEEGIKASEILRRKNPELANQWDKYPDTRNHVAFLFAEKYLLGRSSGITTLTPDAKYVFSAAVNDRQWRLLFPEHFTNEED